MRIWFCKIIIKFGKHQRNKIQSPEIDSHLYCQFIFNNTSCRIQWGKEHIFFFVYSLTNSAGTTRYNMEINDPQFSPKSIYKS